MLSESVIKTIITQELYNRKLTENVEEYVNVNLLLEEILLERQLNGEPMTVPELRKLLRKKVLNFEFIKLNGEKRPARGTTMMSKIPAKDHPKGTGKSSPKVATFYDLDKGEWRSVSQDSDEIVIKKEKDKDRPIIVVKEKPEGEEKEKEKEKEEKPKEEPRKEEKPQEEPEEQPIVQQPKVNVQKPILNKVRDPELKTGDIRLYKNINGKEILIKILKVDKDYTVEAETVKEKTPFTIPVNMLQNISKDKFILK